MLNQGAAPTWLASFTMCSRGAPPTLAEKERWSGVGRSAQVFGRASALVCILLGGGQAGGLVVVRAGPGAFEQPQAARTSRNGRALRKLDHRAPRKSGGWGVSAADVSTWSAFHLPLAHPQPPQ